MKQYLDAVALACEQTWVLMCKHFAQKRRGGRTTLKEVFVTPFFLFLFTGILIITASTITFPPSVYALHPLPPLSDNGYDWGIFSESSPANNDDAYGYVSSTNLYYSPQNNAGVQAAMQALQDMYPDVTIIGQDSADDVTNEYTSNLFNTWAAIEFELTSAQIASNSLVVPGQPNEVTYKIRISPVTSILPSYDEQTVYNDLNTPADEWANSGYLTIQNFLNTYLAEVQMGAATGSFTVGTYVQRYPASSAYDGEFSFDMSTMRWFLWKWMAPTIITIALFTPMLGFLTQLVREKQYRMKDLLEISGLYDFSFWAAFLLATALMVQFSIWVGSLLLTAMGTLTTYNIMAYIALMTCYTLAVCAFSFAFSHVIDRSEFYGLPIFILNTGLAIGGVFIANNTNLTVGVKLLVGLLLPPVQLANGVFSIENFCYHNQQDLVDMNAGDLGKGLPTPNEVCAIMIVSCVCYFMLAWGFPFDWINPSGSGDDNAGAHSVRADIVPYHCDNQDQEEKEARVAAGNSAAAPSRGRVLLDVQDIEQIYPDGTQAVKSMSFQVHDGEVLSYLGANGAGKSTTMGMLCGTLMPTYGDAYVNGYSITRDRTNARRNLGICMQQDVIWDDVSVEDHLLLFGQLRGSHGEKLKTDVTRMLNSLGFPEKAKSLAGTLSGGQKRRLCVGLAMVGGNSVVFLDEPTAGLDPVSRRQLWELIQANRSGRAILLTTHFMDEADVLGDRIAIVKEGRLRALGSSKFLKQRFGLGYLLRCSLKQGAEAAPITACIQKFVPSAAVVSAAGTELAIRMPKEAVSVFADMMSRLETDGKGLGVLSFGIETTTLEEVFMRIVNEDTATMMSNPEEANRMLGASATERAAYNSKIKAADDKRNPLSEEQLGLLLTQGRKHEQAEGGADNRGTLSHVRTTKGDEDGFAVFTTQMRVLLWKRRHQFDRSRGQWAFSFVVPVGLLCLAAVVANLIPRAILGSNPDVTDIGVYTPYMTTPVAGASEAETLLYAENAGLTSPSASTNYVGTSYSSVYNYIDTQSTDLIPGNNSMEGVYFNSYNNFTVMYNATMAFDYPAAVGQLLQAAVTNYTQGNLTVNTVCQPLQSSAINEQANYGLLTAFVLAVWVGSMGGGMSIVLSGERVGLVKHQQLASGTAKMTYWASNLLFDYCMMLLHLFFLTFAMYCIDSTDFGGNGAGDVLYAGVIFLFAAIFRFYVVSFLVDDVRMVQSIYFYGSLLSMYVCCIVWAQVVFTAFNGDMGAPPSVFMTVLLSIIDPAFGFSMFVLFTKNFLGAATLYPSMKYNIVPALLGAAAIMLALLVTIEFGSDVSAYASYLWHQCFGGERVEDESNTRASMIGATGVGAGAQDLMVEDGAGSNKRQVQAERRSRPAGAMDPDIVAEKARVQAVYDSRHLNKADHAIFVHNLSKVFHGRGTVPTKVAVNDVSVAVELGEVFGLLGANGAGKTTMLKIVSGLELPTTGQAYINGYNVVRHRTDAQRSMGLCPQFDTLIERLSVRENLHFFGMIKGIRDGYGTSNLTAVCEAYMVALNIKRYENKLIQHLSGGNRRKVSLAVALLGCPPTVYLDEPSTGLDPVASRLMWRLLSKISSTRSNAIVLTTHNMLECEAVCTRIGVMKAGELVCLGDSQHLRSVHGTGYLLEVTVATPSGVPVAKRFVEQHFSGCVVVDEHSTMINFEIPAASVPKLSAAFRLIEDNKAELNIADYSLSQSTLEQVFLKQIRPSAPELSVRDTLVVDEQEGGRPSLIKANSTRTPRTLDYINGYMAWLLAAFLPGLHQFYLGDTWRGVKYFFTLNELYVGWMLDLFEMHVLIQKRVEQYGNATALCCFVCCSASSSDTGVNRNKATSEGYGNNAPASGSSSHALQSTSSYGSGGRSKSPKAAAAHKNALQGALLDSSVTGGSGGQNPVHN